MANTDRTKSEEGMERNGRRLIDKVARVIFLSTKSNDQSMDDWDKDLPIGKNDCTRKCIYMAARLALIEIEKCTKG